MYQPPTLPSSTERSTYVSTWQQKYVQVMTDLHDTYDDLSKPPVSAVQAVLALAAEIRKGLDAGLLDADTVPPPANRPDCPDCSHTYPEHTHNGCMECACTTTRAVLVAFANTLANRGL